LLTFSTKSAYNKHPTVATMTEHKTTVMSRIIALVKNGDLTTPSILLSLT